MKFQGILTALVTPMNDQFQVDEEQLRQLVRLQIESGIHGLVMLGGTGEYAALSAEERQRAVRIAKEEAAGRVPVVAGVLEPGFGECMKACKAFEAMGVDALLVLTPFYLSPSQPGIIDYFQRVDQAVHTPIILYNIPYRTSVNMTPETVETIVNTTKNVVGIKECSPDLGQNIDLLRRVGDRISVLSGEEFLAGSVMTYGACGGIIATANVLPKIWLELYNKASSGQYKEAADLVKTYIPLFKALFREANPGPIKYAMRRLGLPGGRACTPIPADPTPETQAVIDKLLKEFGLL
ncbi:4-hydroxy-tetrahydrodipicolinate synthase [Pseudoflavonifractor sp. AF19-9AC]|uniref:4-hydroxy-tetrahydrodipicolinate synthase n=1 Tax=Pseudoflavonifractor sp. AF19-9AC TaxID=2292244 RepID=UPI000E46EA01|nr:4-hydroxy-tetrahydrodipicolinate synthase [Pseudoflavonifractor sp. AF19-9AC]RHR05202.1 4-hydroxy-tetrahydrodipicolinate synthase [Pseudoflavonifractor sp. AF19-9AC]